MISTFMVSTLKQVFDGPTHIAAHHLSGLIVKLSPHAHSWENIGLCLGFQPNEIAKPYEFPWFPRFISE